MISNNIYSHCGDVEMHVMMSEADHIHYRWLRFTDWVSLFIRPRNYEQTTSFPDIRDSYLVLSSVNSIRAYEMVEQVKNCSK
jgi:hypothetical protein